MKKVLSRVLLISDTHGRLTYFPTALKMAGKVDMILHMGDSLGGLEEISAIAGVPVVGVRGNCDFTPNLERDKEFNICGVPVFMTHGHTYYVSHGMHDLVEEGERRCVSVVCFGHTHVPFFEKIGDILYVNPGSLSLPRQEGHRPTFAVMEIKEDGLPYIYMKTI